MMLFEYLHIFVQKAYLTPLDCFPDSDTYPKGLSYKLENSCQEGVGAQCCWAFSYHLKSKVL